MPTFTPARAAVRRDPSYREIHEHGVAPADIPALLARDGAWYVNGAADAFTGRPAWGYAEAAEVQPDGWVVVTLTDPMTVAAFTPADPMGRPAYVTLSRSYAEGQTCAVCGEVATHPARRTPATPPAEPATAEPATAWHIVRTADTHYAATVHGTRADAEHAAATYRPNGRDIVPAYAVPAEPDYPATATARAAYGDAYADGMQRHTAELLARHGIDRRADTLGARLAGNDGA